jgi:hypothetical protein
MIGAWHRPLSASPRKSITSITPNGYGLTMITSIALAALAASRVQTPVTAEPKDSTRWFGTSVMAIGDLDKDGAPDFLVGEGSAHAPELGRVWAVSSKSLHALWCTRGDKRGDGFAASIAVVPDVSADGIQDVVVSASESIVLLSGLDGHVLKRIAARERGVGFGSSVIAAGGRNERKETTVFVSAPNARDGDMQRGAIDAISLPSGSFLRSVHCSHAHSSFGSNLYPCPDLDGDGHGDLMVTLYESDHPVAVEVLSGAELKLIRYVINGSNARWFGESLSCCADLTGDHVPEIAVGIPMHLDNVDQRGRVEIISVATDSRVAVFEGESESSEAFGSSLANIGDVNGDGSDDLAIGACDAGMWLGAVRIYSGSSPKPAFVVGQQPNLFHIGRALSRLGDVDGDGLPEFLIGVNCYDNVDEDGAVLIVGKRGASVRVILGSTLRKQLAEGQK